MAGDAVGLEERMDVLEEIKVDGGGFLGGGENESGP